MYVFEYGQAQTCYVNSHNDKRSWACQSNTYYTQPLLHSSVVWWSAAGGKKIRCRLVHSVFVLISLLFLLVLFSEVFLSCFFDFFHHALDHFVRERLGVRPTLQHCNFDIFCPRLHDLCTATKSNAAKGKTAKQHGAARRGTKTVPASQDQAFCRKQSDH